MRGVASAAVPLAAATQATTQRAPGCDSAIAAATSSAVAAGPAEPS